MRCASSRRCRISSIAGRAVISHLVLQLGDLCGEYFQRRHERGKLRGALLVELLRQFGLLCVQPLLKPSRGFLCVTSHPSSESSDFRDLISTCALRWRLSSFTGWKYR